MVSKTKKKEERNEQGNECGVGVGVGVGEYEQSREQRIKQNLQRMQQLGILDLSRNLKPKPKPKTPIVSKKPPPLPSSPRRSSRIKILPTISYFEKRVPQEKVVKEVKIEIKEGPKPEVYTEGHEKMLGDHKEAWALAVDGYDDEGNRMYDGYAGKSCHQCRQKTIGLRTKCSKCKIVQGQFCGDCLFMRYGENVEEANANPDWVCPVCRDICNCSRCRKVKGWEPTGNLYRKTLQLGFKSVAHYLIHTRGPHGKQEDKEGDLLDDDNMDEDSKHNLTEKNTKHHDQQCKGDDDNVDPDYESASLEDDDDHHDDEDKSSAED